MLADARTRELTQPGQPTPSAPKSSKPTAAGSAPPRSISSALKYKPTSSSSKPKDPRGGSGRGGGNTTIAEKLQKAGSASAAKKSGAYLWASSAAHAENESEEDLPASVNAGALHLVSQLLKRVQSGLQLVVSSVCDQIRSAMQSATRSEISTFRVLFRQEAEQFVKVIEKEKKVLATNRREFEARLKAAQRSKPVVELYSWCAVTASGTHICVACSAHAHMHPGQGINFADIPWLAQNGGLIYESRGRFQRKAWKHDQSSLHELCMEDFHESAACPIETALVAQSEHSKAVTENLFKLTLDNARKYRAFLDYESLVKVVHECGGDVGDWLHSRETSRAMTLHLQDHFVEQFNAFTSSIDPATGKLRHCGCASDKVSDATFVQWQLSCGRMRKGGSPFTFVMSMRKMGETSKGVDCYRELRGSQGDVGLVPAQGRAYVFDGEACYSGDGTTADTVKFLLLEQDARNSVLRDPPHCCDIGRDRMNEHFQYIPEVLELIKSVYSDYSVHGKKLAGCEKIAEALGVDWKQLHYIFPVRFVESEYIAVLAFMDDYPVIVTDYRQRIEAATDDSTMDVAKVKHWLRRMLQFKFVAVCLILLDIDKSFKTFSKATQSDENLSIDYPTFQEKFFCSMRRCTAGCLGSHIKRNLASLKVGKYAGVQLQGFTSEISSLELAEPERFHPDIFEVEAVVSKRAAGRGYQYLIKWKGYPESANSWEAASKVEITAKQLTDAYNRGDSVADQQAAARDARRANRAAFAEAAPAEGLPSGDRVAIAAAIEARLKTYATAMTNKLMSDLEELLPVPTVMLQLRAIFDYRRMPLGQGAQDDSELQTWSNQEIDSLVESHFSDLDADIVKNQALQVRVWLRSNQHKHIEQVEVLDEGGDTVLHPSTKKPVLQTRIKVCGEGSVMEALFKDGSTLFPAGLQSYLHIADYMIAFMFNQSCTERAGRNMVLTKSPSRRSLGDDAFAALVWLSFNAPPTHQVDFRAIVLKWIMGGKHRLAGQSDGEGSRVLQRLYDEVKCTILH